MSILKLIASKSWGVYNKEIAKKIGLEEAIILGELASEHDYWLKQNDLTVDGYFYSTVENIENETTLSEYRQRKAMNTLKSLKLIDVELKGCPPKRYIKMNEMEIEKLLLGIHEIKTTGIHENNNDNQLSFNSVKSKDLIPEELRTNNNKKNKNKDKLAKANASSQVSSNIDIDKDDNLLDVKQDNLDKSRNVKKDLIPFIEESFNDSEVKDILIEWLLDVFANGKTLTLKQLRNQCDLLTSNCETKEELISLVNKTLESKWATFRYVIEKKQNTNKPNNNIRITEQKRTTTLGTECF